MSRNGRHLVKSRAVRPTMARLLLAATMALAGACSNGSAGTGSSSGSSSGGGPPGGTTGGGTPASPYTLMPFQNTVITSDSSSPSFQHADATVDFQDGPFQTVTMQVQLTSPCFPFSSWEAVPNGQRWPPNCDAFDRNFEFSLDDPGPDGGPPGLELERAITPFGGPLNLSVDITDVANGLPGQHTLRVVIPTYSDPAGLVSGSAGSWTVSTQIAVTPGPSPRNVLAVEPLFYGPMYAATASQQATIQVPAGTAYGRLEYRVTGHGQDSARDSACIGPAEEFCKRSHTLSVDSEAIATLTPWRSDCACQLADAGGIEYCEGNPCGDPQSVAASRANWCPGSETPPFVFDGGALGSPGSHTVDWKIQRIDDGGGEWETSVTYFAIGN